MLSAPFYDPTYVINEEMLLCNLSLLWQSNHHCCCDTWDASRSLLQKEAKMFQFPIISGIHWETLAISFSSLCLTPCVLPLVLCSSLTICLVGLFHCCGFLLTSLSEVFHQVYTKLPQLSITSLCCLSSRFFVYKISCKNNQPEILISSEYIISIVVLPSTCTCCFPSGKVTEMIELFPVTALHSSAHSVIFHMCTNDKKTQSIKLRDQPESLAVT